MVELSRLQEILKKKDDIISKLNGEICKLTNVIQSHPEQDAKIQELEIFQNNSSLLIIELQRNFEKSNKENITLKTEIENYNQIIENLNKQVFDLEGLNQDLNEKTKKLNQLKEAIKTMDKRLEKLSDSQSASKIQENCDNQSHKEDENPIIMFPRLDASGEMPFNEDHPNSYNDNMKEAYEIHDSSNENRHLCPELMDSHAVEN